MGNESDERKVRRGSPTLLSKGNIIMANTFHDPYVPTKWRDAKRGLAFTLAQ